MADDAARRVVIPYCPRAIWLDYHQNRTRESCVVAHRRAGKTVAMVNEKIKSALLNKRPNPRTAYIAPTYRQAKRIAWDYAKHYGLSIPGTEANEVELRLDFPNGGRFQLLGQDNPDSLRGTYFDDVGCDEFQLWNPRVYPEIIRPALADRAGSATFSGTPAGTENPLYEAWERLSKSGAYCRVFRASDTGLIPEDELAALRATMSDEQYAQEFECSWTSAMIGSIYGRALDEIEKAGRMRELPILPHVPVDVSFDLGRRDSTAMWFVQVVQPETRLIGYYESNGHDIAHYATVLEDWRRRHGFNYGTLLLPHDAEQQHMTGESVADTLRGMRYNVHVCPRGDASREIHTVRVLMRSMWIDPTRCRDGLKCLRNYRYAYNEDRKAFYDRPEHDWTSHGADALRVYAVNRGSYATAGWGSSYDWQTPSTSIA